MENETTEKDPMEEVTRAIKAAAESGNPIIGHFGSVAVAGRESNSTWWSIRTGNATKRLLTNPDYKVAQILSVLGSETRLAILRSLLAAPKTATELVGELGMKTTGQAYHHLRELESAGYIDQKGGQYHFNMAVGRVYLTALALAADAGAEKPDEN